MATCIPNVYLISGPEQDCVPFDLPADWMAVAEGISQATQSTPSPAVIFVVGPRKVGKSTMARFLCNATWNRHRGPVAFLDLDSGQTEFTPPGCVALKALHAPLLGPSLSHQALTDGLVYLGSPSPSDDPKAYTAGARRLVEMYLRQLRPNGIPLIVNTMGWVTGLGLSLLQGLLQMLPVTHVIAFGQANEISDPFDYVQKVLFDKTPWSPGFTAESAPQVAYVQPAESSGTATSRVARISPVDLRAMTFAAYFLGKTNAHGHVVYPDQSPSFRSLTPLTVPISSIKIFYAEKNSKLPPKMDHLALNLAMVGLAHRNASSGDIKCIGLGIVRSVDRQQGFYSILTPIPLATLREANVNCFILGRIYLPNTFLTV